MRRRRLDDLAVDRGEAERQRDERQRDEEDRVADHHRPRRAVEAERRPEGEEAERGDDGRQDEGRQPEHLEDAAPSGRAAAIATRPAGRRSATESAADERAMTTEVRRAFRQPGSATIWPIPVRAKSRPAGNAASSACVHRNAGDDDDRRRQEQRDDSEEDQPASSVALMRRAPRRPIISDRPTSAEADQHEEDRHRGGERHVRLVDRLVGDQHRERPVLRPAEKLRQQIGAEREDEDHDEASRAARCGASARRG